MSQQVNQKWVRFPESLQDIFEGLWQEVASLHAQWELYQDLFTNADDIELINSTVPGVFQIIEENLRVSMTLAFGRLTDPIDHGKKRQNLSLARLVDTIKSHGETNLTLMTTQVFDQIRAECKPFSEHRNRKFAHNDLSTTVNYKENPLPGIGRNRIENALVLVARLMNLIQIHFEDGETAYAHGIQMGRGRDLLFCIRQSVELDRMRHEAEVARYRNVN